MSAIGINVSSRDAIPGWDALRPPKRTPLEVALIEAREEATDKWNEYNDFADYLERLSSAGFVEQHVIDSVRKELNQKYIKAMDADGIVNRLYSQINCPHVHVDMEGSEYQSGGEREDNIRPVCRDCGAVVDIVFHNHIVEKLPPGW